MAEPWHEQPAWHPAETDGAGLRLVERAGLCLTQVIARRNGAAAVAEKLAMPLPETPNTRCAIDDGEALCLRPGDWLLMRDDPAGRRGGFALSLRDRLAGLAAVIDQSHGRVVLGLEGTDARNVLQQGLDLDMHESVFADGAMAQTSFGGIAITMLEHSAERFDILVARSFAADLAHHLTAGR